MSILAKYWRPLAIIIIVVLCALWVRGEIISYGDQRYADGYEKAVADQKAADEQEEQRRNAELQKIQADARQRIDAARNDAVNAAAKSGRLQQQLANIRKQLVGYSTTESIGNPAAETGVLLSGVLSKSVERNRQLADYADRAREAGLACEAQYNSLRNKKAP
ncbi:tail protein [Escherichia phage vB_EcoS_ASO78B]|nr:tail protein [Escherichia phage vB_EcoS_ASO78B]